MIVLVEFFAVFIKVAEILVGITVVSAVRIFRIEMLEDFLFGEDIIEIIASFPNKQHFQHQHPVQIIKIFPLLCSFILHHTLNPGRVDLPDKIIVDVDTKGAIEHHIADFRLRNPTDFPIDNLIVILANLL